MSVFTDKEVAYLTQQPIGRLATAGSKGRPMWSRPGSTSTLTRAWWRSAGTNIAAHPDKVQVEIDGCKVAVIPEQLHGAGRDEAWRQITAAAPRFAGYQEKTDRELPVIRLVPRSG